MEIVCTNDLSELPPAATKEREFLAQSGVQSILVYPLLVSNQLAGFLGCSMETAPRNWSEEDFRLLSLVSEQFMHFFERKAALRAQMAGEERLRAIFHNAGVGMALSDPGGIILDSNAELQTFLGYAASELRGKSSRDFTHPADYSLEVGQVRQAIAEGLNRTQIEKRFIRKDGSVVWGILTLSFVRNEQGQITYLIAAVKDITERKRVEQELRSRQSLLEAVTLVAEQFLSKENLDESVRNAIEALGWATGATHVSIFENAINDEGRVYPHYRYEWTAPGATQSDDGQLHQDPIRSGFGRWADLLSRNKIVKARASLAPTGSLFRGNKSILVVPIFVQTRWWGGICVDDALHERDWAATEEDALRLAASLVGLAIQRQQYDQQNRQLLAAESAARKLAEALGKSAADLNASLNLDSVLDSMMANIGKVAVHDAVNIMLVDNGQARVFRAQGYQRRSSAGNNLPDHAVINSPAMRQAAENRRPFILSDATTFVRQSGSEHMQWVRSLATIPIQHQGVVIGFINLQSATPNAFLLSQADTLQAYANQAALALQNARLFETVQENAHRLSILNEISRIAISAPSLETLLDGLANRVQSLFGMDAAYITLWEEDNHRVIPVSASGEHGTTYSTSEVVAGEVTLTESVLNASRVLIVEDAYHSPYISARIARMFNETSIIGIPLIVGDRKLGALIMGYTLAHKFMPEEVALAEQAGRQIALAVAKAELVGEVQRLAVTDDLMGLYNYRGLMQLGDQEVERAHRYDRPLSAIMMDIDRFKTLNDTYSHIVGNEILCQLADRCRQVVRDADIVTRYGGDELCILLVETDEATALSVAERIRLSVSGAPFLVSVGAIPATISLGVSTLLSGESLNQLIARADRGLYHAKEGGRNRVVFERV
ncbi:MAG TPA: diguanylate cyclase [Anaerolineaceae bacterium]|nr:diguanylate cyclase [Anaerolineaceae bacterium]